MVVQIDRGRISGPSLVQTWYYFQVTSFEIRFMSLVLPVVILRLSILPELSQCIVQILLHWNLLILRDASPVQRQNDVCRESVLCYEYGCLVILGTLQNLQAVGLKLAPGDR